MVPMFYLLLERILTLCFVGDSCGMSICYSMRLIYELPTNESLLYVLTTKCKLLFRSVIPISILSLQNQLFFSPSFNNILADLPWSWSKILVIFWSRFTYNDGTKNLPEISVKEMIERSTWTMFFSGPSKKVSQFFSTSKHYISCFVLGISISFYSGSFKYALIFLYSSWNYI